MMMVLIYGGISVMEDRKRRVLARILFSSTSFAELFGGKFLGRVLMGLLQSAILIAAGLLFFRLNLGNIWLSGLNILVFAAAMAALSIFVGSAIRKEEVIVGISVLLANLFAAWAAAGGRPRSCRPFSAPWAWSPRLLGHGRLPQGHLLRQGLRRRLANLLVLLAYTAVFMAWPCVSSRSRNKSSAAIAKRTAPCRRRYTPKAFGLGPASPWSRYRSRSSASPR